MATQHPIPTDPRFKDLTGKAFCRLLVLAYAGRDKWHKTRWLCRCDCGTKKVVSGSHLGSGATLSCGCLAETRRANRRTHGLTHSPEWNTWVAMKERCSNPRQTAWGRYGGRGIKICDRWIGSFENFLADMGRKPTPQHSIDRIDNDGNYEPGNCRWASPSAQARNNSRTLNLGFAGETLCLREWARRKGIPEGTLYARVVTRGWPIERALTTPVCVPKRHAVTPSAG